MIDKLLYSGTLIYYKFDLTHNLSFSVILFWSCVAFCLINPILNIYMGLIQSFFVESFEGLGEPFSKVPQTRPLAFPRVY